jgi:hypothetical protein
MMSIAASFPLVKKPRYVDLERRDKRLNVMLASFATAPDNLYMAPHPSFALQAAMWNLHTT